MELIYRIKKPETIARFLHENNIPTKIIEVLNQKLHITVNQELKSKADTIRKGDTLHIFIQDEGIDQNIKPEKASLDIVYEDDYFLVVNKPENMQVMTSKAHPEETLANRIQAYYIEKEIHNNLYFVNRVDKESAGLVFVAKHRFLKYLMSEKFQDSIERQFYAILDGKLEVKKNCIDLPISRVEGSIKREVVFDGEECKTSYEVLKENQSYSLVKIQLLSDKTHQIRVHFSYLYYPVVGDEIYNSKTYSTNQLMLFSSKIAFHHPILDQKITVELPIPAFMTKFMNG